VIRRLEDRLYRWLAGRNLTRALADPEGKYVCPKCRGFVAAATTEQAIHYHLRFGCEPMNAVEAGREVARLLRKREQATGR
jgi:hypothetical protein